MLRVACSSARLGAGVPIPKDGIIVRHGQKNSWLMNYSMKELFYSAKGGKMAMMPKATGSASRGANNMFEENLLMYHDSKYSRINKYGLPGINVPQHVLSYPKMLEESEVEAIKDKIYPRQVKEVDTIDVSNADDVRRYKWANRFGTKVFPDLSVGRGILKDVVPTFYPGSKPIETIKELRVTKGGGFSGGIRAGQTLGSPQSKYIDAQAAEEFQSVLIDMRRVSHSRPTGRRRSFRATVVVGNGNGLVGYETANGGMIRAAARKARNKAILRLYHVELCENHTIFRNMDVRRGRTRMFWHRREPGAGLLCHRISRVVCQLAGVKDVHAKIHGTMNPISVVGCTLKALTGQLSHQEFADHTGKHVIELRKSFGMRPIVVASPKQSLRKPSPLLKVTKQPYTGLVQVPHDVALATWYKEQEYAEEVEQKQADKFWALNAPAEIET